MSDQKPDDDSVLKPQVIDLDAEEITSGPDVDMPASAVPPAPRPARKSYGTAYWIIGALALGLVAGGWIYRDILAGYLPSDAMVAMQSRVAALEANGRTLNQQLAAVGQSANGAMAAVAALDQAARSGAAGIADLTARIEPFESRIAAAEQTIGSAKADLASLRSALSSGGSAPAAAGSPDNAALAALGQRIDALEKDLASLKSARGSGGTATLTSALSQALADLKAKVAAGTGYQAEHERIARMVPAAPGLDVLASRAADGIPAAAGLAQELRAAIPALPQPEAAEISGEKSYWDEVLDTFSGIITIRDIGEANWPQLAEKAAAFAEAGDLRQAISSIEAAEGAKPSALTQWRDRAAARLQLEGAVDQVSEAALRQITALGGAP